MPTTSELALTIGCFYEGTPVPFHVVADALGITVGALCGIVRAEQGSGEFVVSRDWRVPGPQGMRLAPAWAVAS